MVHRRHPPAVFDWFFEAGRPKSLEEGKVGNLGLGRGEGGQEAASSAAPPPPTDPPILWQIPPDFQEQVGIQEACQGWASRRGPWALNPALRGKAERQPC